MEKREKKREDRREREKWVRENKDKKRIGWLYAFSNQFPTNCADFG